MTESNTIKICLKKAVERLKTSSPTAQLDAELLFAHVLKKSRAFLYAHSDDALAAESIQQLESVISKRITGVPIAYLLGEREFWSLLFYVTPDTLIPRPETELLIELSLSLLGAHKTCSVLELGTGTGAIAIALASEKPLWHLLASDKSIDALSITKQNMQRHHIKNITLIESDWFEKLSGLQFNLIISNPPYLAADDPHQHQGDLRFEPKGALLSGEDGFDDLNHLIQKSMHYLTPGGLLLLEHGYDQADKLIEKLNLAGYQNVQSWQDENGYNRVVSGWKVV
ncbi:MAG: peptide chain release factor N(5)-glutamine methyltransferase [Gammaproteobacteria bacterium]|nr:peptide chain release factor N(5)-glutamine methyltransferase [Gammaproteobacteria bacterium]